MLQNVGAMPSASRVMSLPFQRASLSFWPGLHSVQVLTIDSLSTDNAQPAATCFEDVAGVSHCTDRLVLDRDIDLERAQSVNGKEKRPYQTSWTRNSFSLQYHGRDYLIQHVPVLLRSH